MNFCELEQKWQKKWQAWALQQTPDTPRKKFYLLEMFAYPSGDIHLGHFRNYGIGDVVWRTLRMKGYDLLHPFGWDAFGLPAEQAAVKHGFLPREWTRQNIQKGNSTLKRIGFSYDWQREVRTCEPDYYHWTQWIFLKLHEAGLVYRDTGMVNWCAQCGTVLANEQVIGGTCWRCHSKVVKRELLQWYVKITDYAERLLQGLDELEGQWPNGIIAMQKYWIGRSEGGEFDFTIQGTDIRIPIFTTRPDTIFGVTFMTVAPDARIMKTLLPLIPREHKHNVTAYIRESQAHSEIERTAEDREKDGVFTGLYARNPFNNERVQVWVGDYVLASYGTGAVMAVPAHDQRDFAFAKRYDIPIKVVVRPADGTLNAGDLDQAFVDHGVMTDSGEFSGLSSEKGGQAVTAHARNKGFGRPKITYRLRDWLVSRQRYWGAPIPMIHCPACGVLPVPEKDLPVRLPDIHSNTLLPKGRSPLDDQEAFIHTVCPQCGEPARRDPDTLDTFVCSSWYYLRYLSPKNPKQAFTQADAQSWLPIDLYIGGSEHACGHLLYFRFVHKVLFDLGYIPAACGDEPAKRLYNHGMVLDAHGDVMSKSKGNAVSPEVTIQEYGVDATRVAMFFFAPPHSEILWSDSGLKGATRFIRRTQQLFAQPPQSRTKPSPDELSPADRELLKLLHRTIKKVGHDMEVRHMHFNTAIAALMEFINQLPKRFGPGHPLYFTIFDNYARMLAPFAPYTGEELHERLGHQGSVFLRAYPEYDENLARLEEVQIGVQVNGKLRGTIEIAVDAGQDQALAKARADQRVQRWLEGKTQIKVIYKAGRILNIIVK